jgi:germination protein M
VKLGVSILAAALVAGSLSACSPSTGVSGTVLPPSAAASVDVGPGPTPGPSDSPSSPSGSPTGEPEASPIASQPSPSSATGTQLVRTYFVMGGPSGSTGLVATLRKVPGSNTPATAAINALLAGSSAAERAHQITSAIPDGSKLLGLTIKNRLATIDLSSEFESDGGSASIHDRLGQVVYTLTQFSTVHSVAFKIEGQTASNFGSAGVTLDGPVGRADFVDQLPAIFVDRPASGAAIGNPARVAGSADVFEATFRLTLLDGGGRTLVDKQVMASCGSGCRGTFDVTLKYDVPKAQWGTLRAWDGSAKDGTPENVREYPVWLTPAA